ncbi:1-acyl-sn-glycerol-3-phosphate acyltransferase [Myxococcota bacterium]
MMYRLIMRLVGMAADLFYCRRDIGGTVPENGPLVLVANHPNALVDPVLVARVADRPLRFLAKAPLFDMPVIGWLVRWVGALPVYRAVDGASTSQNVDTFTAVHEALIEGDAVCLFPEGVSHSQPALQPLKTGAARMALEAEVRRDFGLGVRIVPVGLTYRDKAMFRSEVAIQVGVPIPASRVAPLVAEDDRAAARALTGCHRRLRQPYIRTLRPRSSFRSAGCFPHDQR